MIDLKDLNDYGKDIRDTEKRVFDLKQTNDDVANAVADIIVGRETTNFNHLKTLKRLGIKNYKKQHDYSAWKQTTTYEVKITNNLIEKVEVYLNGDDKNE